MQNYKINGLLIVINSHYLFTKAETSWQPKMICQGSDNKYRKYDLFGTFKIVVVFFFHFLYISYNCIEIR